jgi:type IV secretion system protein VirD4
MSQNVNLPNWAKVILVIGAALAAVGVWAYLAGGIMLATQHQDYNAATPITLYQYWYYYNNNPAIMKWIYISAGVSFGVIVAPFLFLFKREKLSLHGKARFASKAEIKKAGLLSDVGIIVGKYKGKFLMFAGQQHAMLSAPTRAGKGVGIVITNLLAWWQSVVVLDIKQENYDITSAFRSKHGHKCYLFNPAATDYRTHRYNPLHYISNDPNFRIDDIQKIAGMLFPDQEGTDPIWTATPRSLFLGIVLMLMETPGKLVTLGQVLRETLVEGDGAKYFTALITDRQQAGNPLSGVCIRALNSYVSIASDNTRSGIMTSFRSRLELWNNPIVDAATSANDFDLREVRTKLMSIYIGVTPDNLDRMAPLINLFFQQLVDLNTRELPQQRRKKRVNPDGTVDLPIKYTCLLLMDEFTAIGKMGVLSKGISYIAGYWLRMLPIIQSPTQLDDVYGEKASETFKVNHALQIVFPPKATETKVANAISEWLGYNTVDGVSTSTPKGLFKKSPGSESTSDQRRALMLPQEITGMKQGTELVIMEGVRPIVAQKITYYNDPAFVDRLKAVSPSLAALGKKIPTQSQLETAIEKGELKSPVPLIDLNLHANLIEGNNPEQSVIQAIKKSDVIVTVRPFTTDEIINIDSAVLSDFAVDFSNVMPPRPADNESELDIEKLNAYADDLCASVGITVDNV